TGTNSWVADSAGVIGRVFLGDEVSIWPGAVLRGDVSEIHIGSRSNVQDGTVIHVDHTEQTGIVKGASAVIGDDVTVGHRAVLHACEVQNAVLVGMGAIVLDGAVIGSESIIAAGSLVTKGKNFPPRSLIMGSPASVIRDLTDEEVRALYESAKNYVLLKNIYLKSVGVE
ncbi:MAG: gamma carbonic anhydrase family protein, partial [Spirochaetota bacterium]